VRQQLFALKQSVLVSVLALVRGKDTSNFLLERFIRKGSEELKGGQLVKKAVYGERRGWFRAKCIVRTLGYKKTIGCEVCITHGGVQKRLAEVPKTIPNKTPGGGNLGPYPQRYHGPRGYVRSVASLGGEKISVGRDDGVKGGGVRGWEKFGPHD